VADARYLEHAMRDTGVVELRHERGGRWSCTAFTDALALRTEARRRAGGGNLYITLNAPRAGQLAAPLKDEDIGTIVRLPLDFDPLRPPGLPSTAAELQAAVEARDRAVAALAAAGLPAPATAFSGNGAHALYRVRLRADAATREMLATLYVGWGRDFGNDLVKFDTTVRNPGRVWRLYGTANRKGRSTPERPHRVATVTLPDRWQAASPSVLDRLANAYARRLAQAPVSGGTARPTAAGAPPCTGALATLDAPAWFAAAGLYRRPLGGGKHAVACPWSQEHSTADGGLSTATVLWEADGERWPRFHCSHAHCAGRRLTDALALLGDADRYCSRAWRATR
jgi:hypothetical protein